MAVADSGGGMKVVYIKWVDSAATHGWLRPEEVGKHSTECYSVGFLVDKNKKTVTIAQSLMDENMLGEFLTIPKVCIISMREVK